MQLSPFRNEKIPKSHGVNERALAKSKDYQKNIKFRYGNTVSSQGAQYPPEYHRAHPECGPGNGAVMSDVRHRRA